MKTPALRSAILTCATMMISLSNINAEDWSHPATGSETTFSSQGTEIWSDGPVFEIGINTIPGSFSNPNAHQQISLVSKDVIVDQSYKITENNAVTRNTVPPTLHSTGQATCDVVNNEIVVGLECVDAYCGMVEIVCLKFLEGTLKSPPW